MGKIEIKGKGKEKESFILFVNIIFNINCGLLVFFDDELTSLRNKIYIFIVMLKKFKIGFMGCVKDNGSIQNEHFSSFFKLVPIFDIFALTSF